MDWEDQDDVPDEVEEPVLRISKLEADKNLELAGSLVDDPEDQISIAKNECLLLNDAVHQMIMEVVDDTKIPFKLGKPSFLNLTFKVIITPVLATNYFL